MMHKKFLIYLTFLLLPLFPAACQKELEGPQGNGTTKEGVWTTVHYRATASGSPETKATLDAIDRHYLFERDDLLYIVDKAHEDDRSNAVLYGYLFLISGAGTSEAVFEGDLMYFVETAPSSGVFEPEQAADDLAITATLVSKTQRDENVYTFAADNEGKIATGPDFGDHYADTFKEAVQKYSTFKADATYGDPSFSLKQGTAFLLVSLSFDDFITSSTPLSISIANNFGTDSPFFTHAISSDDYHQSSFVAAFPGETTILSNARLTVTDGGEFTSTKSLSDATLHANEYYNISKALLDLSYFTIQATNAAATTITFPAYYQTAAYALQYYHEGVWKDVSSEPSFTLNAGESVKVRGKGQKYRYDDAGGSNLFSSSAGCLIYGDILSLFCTGASSYDKPTGFTSANINALEGTFKGMTNLDIHPSRSLLLSARTLAKECYKQMFSGSAITHAPEFFSDGGDYAADIAEGACCEMFKECTSLTAAPALPANGTIGKNGYFAMFSGCTALITPPARLAVSPADGSDSNFREMFKGCSSLISAPALPANVVKPSGCRAMFSGCTSLKAAPDLPAGTVADYAYYYMFQDCSSMTTGPASLPAETMNDYCYAYMFTGSKIAEAPAISAITPDDYCFQGMFSECRSLTRTQDALSITGVPAYSCYRMFYNCVNLNKAPGMPDVGGTVGTQGCYQMFFGCGKMRTAPSALTASGVGDSGYYQMFYNCAWLTVAPGISATTIGASGCFEMFRGCTRLETPPALPATTLGSKAYSGMFRGCKDAMTNPPASLPATTLPAEVYSLMFYDCQKLTSIPSFPTTAITWSGDRVCYQMFQNCYNIEELTEPLFSGASTLRKGCFEDMFAHCTKLATVPSNLLPATTLAVDCYRGMFQDTALTTAPDLLAPTIVTTCYRYMFNKCTSLTSIRCHGTNPTAANLQNWLQNASSTGTLYIKSGTYNSWPQNSVHGIPAGWNYVEEP